MSRVLVRMRRNDTQQRAQQDEAGALRRRIEEVVAPERQLEPGKHVHRRRLSGQARRLRQRRARSRRTRRRRAARSARRPRRAPRSPPARGGRRSAPARRRGGPPGPHGRGRAPPREVGVDGTCVRTGRAWRATSSRRSRTSTMRETRLRLSPVSSAMAESRSRRSGDAARRPEDLQGAQAQAVGGLELGVERAGEPCGASPAGRSTRRRGSPTSARARRRPRRTRMPLLWCRARRHCACQDKDSPALDLTGPAARAPRRRGAAARSAGGRRSRRRAPAARCCAT